MRKLQLDPDAEWLLQRPAAREWEIGELHMTVLSIPGARMLYQLENWPWHQTIEYVGMHGRYLIKMPRVSYQTGERCPVAKITVYSTSRGQAAQGEVIAFLAQLASSP